MKQKLLLKSLVLLFALIAGSSSAWANDVTFSFSDYKGNGTSGTGSSYTMTKTDVNIENSKFYCGSSASYAQFYAGGTTTITPASGVTITSVVLTASATGYNGYQSSGTITASTGSVSGSTTSTTVTWTGSATSAFTISNNKQIRWTSIVVTYTGGTPTCATPTFSPAAGVYTSDQTVSISTETEEATIHYTTNGSVPTSTSPTYIMPIYATGVLTVKAIAVKDGYNNSDVATATYAILAHAGTAGDPYSVADARTAIDAGVGLTDVYVTGIVCEGASSLESGALSYWISDDGTETNKFEIYKGKGVGGADFSSTDDVQVGDIVVVRGDIKKLGDIYEFNYGSQLISLTPDARAAAGLSWSESEIIIAQGATDSEYTLPVLSNPNSLTPISYNITGTDNLAIEVDGDIIVDTDIVGSVTVTATFAGDASYKPGSASYTITVYDPTAKGTKYNPYTVAEVEGQATATTFGNNIYVTGYIVGCVKDNKCYKTTTGSLVNTNFLLADTPDLSFTEGAAVSSVSGVAPVELPSGTIRTNWGVASNNVFGYKVVVKGNAQGYFSKNGIKSTSEVTAVSVPVTISTYKWATFVSAYALDFDGSAVKAYIVTDHSGNALVKTQMEGTVPANTPLLLNAAKGSFSVPVAASSTTDVSANLLVAGTGVAIESEAGKTKYVLGVEDDAAQFLKITTTPATVPVGKAYLQFDEEISARGFDIDDTTVIDALENATKIDNGAIYDLSGRRVENPTKGIYIMNGKKVIFK